MLTKRAHLFIKGRVQGVFYRTFTIDIANSLGLKGWVKNLPDSRVEAVFEGPETTIKEAILQCYTGPYGARVDDVEVIWEEPCGDLSDFQIRYF